MKKSCELVTIAVYRVIYYNVNRTNGRFIHRIGSLLAFYNESINVSEASLNIKSEVGVGTEITIVIPKQKVKYAKEEFNV